jgi:hypothetical protein
VQLRVSLEAEMRNLGIIDMSNLKSMWRRLDYNNNGVVSLAEIDKMVTDLIAGGTWPSWLGNKPALMRAYKKATLTDGNGDDWVQKKELHALLLNIFWFNKLFGIFQQVDTGHDRRINAQEFTKGVQALGMQMSDAEAQQEFAKMDNNKGGQVLFVEFCAWVRTKVNPDAHAEFDADIVSGEQVGKTLRKEHGHKAQTSIFLQRKASVTMTSLKSRSRLCSRMIKKSGNYGATSISMATMSSPSQRSISLPLSRTLF